MNPTSLHRLVERIHARNCPAVLAVTGGGSGAISTLLSVPGASRTLLEGVVPYAAEALTEWLGATPERFCSSRTARAMAMASYQHARKLTSRRIPVATNLLGVGCTASLASDRPKRGEHRAHLAWQTATMTVEAEVVLQKGARSRAQEEDLVAHWLLLAIDAATQNLSERSSDPELADDEDDWLIAGLLASWRAELSLLADEPFAIDRQTAPPNWQALLAGTAKAAGHGPGALAAPAARPRVLFPGAFNPRHGGHAAMAKLATERLGKQVEYELSIDNVDKPPLDFWEMAHRRQQFAADETLWFTAAPTFVEKSGLFPGSTFVVGADTIARIGAPRYYGLPDSPASKLNRDEAIAAIAAQGGRFLVFGRRRDQGFESLATIDIPPVLRALCEGVSEAEFRADISSTELRQAARNDE